MPISSFLVCASAQASASEEPAPTTAPTVSQSDPLPAPDPRPESFSPGHWGLRSQTPNPEPQPPLRAFVFFVLNQSLRQHYSRGVCYNQTTMPPLIRSNRYLANRASRRAMLVRSVLDSSAFEGATGLAKVLSQRSPRSRKARSIASAKKRVKGS